MSSSTTPGDQCCLMLQVASSIAKAVVTVSPRSTFTGEAWRSAIAPKISGETKAAMAEVANANGLIAFSPCASSTELNGTNQMLIAIHWMKNSPINSKYSVW
jgi:ABC-type branched-subunit amino acid transport system substrate-binding protein